VRHGQRRLSAEALLCLGGSLPDRGKDVFNGVRRPDMFPVLGREVIEGEQVGAVLGQAFHHPDILHTVGFGEEIEGCVGGRLGFGHPYVLQMRLDLRLDRFGHGVKHIRRFVNPPSLNLGLAINLVQRSTEPHRAVADSPFRRDFQPPGVSGRASVRASFGCFRVSRLSGPEYPCCPVRLHQ
jgi:hypothetical protein